MQVSRRAGAGRRSWLLTAHRRVRCGDPRRLQARWHAL